MQDIEETPEGIRAPEEVARRCCVLIGMVAAGHGQPRQPIMDWLKDEDLWESVSPKERLFLDDESPPPQHFVDASWRAEALHALLWSLHALPAMGSLTEMCSLIEERNATPYLQSTSAFIKAASLRPEEEIRRERDEIFDAHWKVRDAQLKGRTVPDALNPGVTYERHYAFNWLIGYCGQPWDEITTDT